MFLIWKELNLSSKNIDFSKLPNDTCIIVITIACANNQIRSIYWFEVRIAMIFSIFLTVLSVLTTATFPGHIRTLFLWMEVVNVWFCRETLRRNLNCGCDKSETCFGTEPAPQSGWEQVIEFYFSKVDPRYIMNASVRL